MKIENDKQLKKLNTFGVSAKAKYFAVVKTMDDLKQVLQSTQFKQSKKHMVLGGGSNILFVNDYKGFLIKNEIKGIKVVKKTKAHTYIKFGAGEIWDDCVKYAVDLGVGGIENLSLIPGTAGAAPFQNIGAYGVEIKDIFYKLEAVEIKSGEIKEFSLKDCGFDYRTSIFKTQLNGKYIITSLTLKLTNKPNYKIEYAGVKEELEKKEINLKSVRKAIIKIRKSKLADPKVLGNAGSFFKNPVISKTKFVKLQKDFPGIPNYPNEDKIKLSAGWLIDQCGLKGFKHNNVGVYENHALVLVNYGKGNGKQIFELKEIIKQKVFEKFGINLEEEVRVIL